MVPVQVLNNKIRFWLGEKSVTSRNNSSNLATLVQSWAEFEITDSDSASVSKTLNPEPLRSA